MLRVYWVAAACGPRCVCEREESAACVEQVQVPAHRATGTGGCFPEEAACMAVTRCGVVQGLENGTGHPRDRHRDPITGEERFAILKGNMYGDPNSARLWQKS